MLPPYDRKPAAGRTASALAGICAAVLLSVAPSLAQSETFHFNTADASLWRAQGSGAVQPVISTENGALKIEWPGGEGVGVVEYTADAPVKPYLHEGFVRYYAEVNIIDDHYGSEVDVQLQPVRANGKQELPYAMRRPMYASGGIMMGMRQSRDPQLFAATGEWARVDFNYRVPSAVAGVRPRFTFRGDAATVLINASELRTGLTWVRGRPSITPESRDFDPRQAAQILKSRERAKPELRQTPDRTALFVNGKDVFPASYHRGLFHPRYAQYRAFSKAGFDIVHLTALLGPLSPTHKNGIGNLWRGPDQFDFTDLENELKLIVSINPDALVVLNINPSPYRQWALDNPDSIVTNAEGQKLVQQGGEGTLYGQEPDYSHSQETDYAPSMYGGQYTVAVEKALRQVAAFLETSEAGKIVYEINLVGGNDGQWYPWDRDGLRGEDHSPDAIAQWRKFLAKRYGNSEQQLRSAWGDSGVSFDSAGVPGIEERGYFKQQLSQRGIDYNDFVSDATANFLIAMCRGVKEGSGGRLLAGVYYHDTFSDRVLSRHAMSRILDTPYIDTVRSIIWDQMSGSWVAHDKLNWNELDVRPPTPNDIMLYHLGLEYTQAFFESFIWRYSARSVTDLGGGYYVFDMAEAWYHEQPELIDFFGTVRAGLAAALDDSVNFPAVVGVFSDERVSFRLGPNGNILLMRTSARGIQEAGERSGLPFRRYLLDDIFNPGLTLPPIVIIRLPMAVTPEEAARIRERVRQDGSILVWDYGAGMAAEGSPSVEAVLGIAAAAEPPLRGKPLAWQPDARPQGERLLGIPAPAVSYRDSNRWAESPLVYQPLASDTVLATYSGTDRPGIVMRRGDGLTEVFLGHPGAVSPQLLRTLAADLGIQPIIASNDVMYTGSGMIVIYADRGGEKTLRLPQGMHVVSSPTGHAFTANGQDCTFSIGYAETAVFAVRKTDRP